MPRIIDTSSKILQWKEKAKSQAKEIAARKKREQEILKSRENWKQKYKEEKGASMGHY